MEITFADVLVARQHGRDALNEASLGRVYQHYKKTKKTSFGIITSWRSLKSDAENMADFKKLQSEIRSAGLGFIKLKGYWRECLDKKVDYKNCPPEKLIDTVELSLFVPGLSKKKIFKLIRKYNQDSAVWAGPETDGEVVLIYDSGEIEKIGKFHPNRIARAYSRLRGKPFSFEGFDYIAQSWGEALIEKYYYDKNLS